MSFKGFILLIVVSVILAVFIKACVFMLSVLFGKKDCSVCSPDGNCPLDRCDLEESCDETCTGCKNYNSKKNCNK